MKMSEVTAEAILAALKGNPYRYSEAAEALADDDNTAPMVACCGTKNVRALRRRKGNGWRYIGFAVWDTVEGGWVFGRWGNPKKLRGALLESGCVPRGDD